MRTPSSTRNRTDIFPRLWTGLIASLLLAVWGLGVLGTPVAQAQDPAEAVTEMKTAYEAAQEALAEERFEEGATHLERVIDRATAAGRTDVAESARSTLGKIRQNLGNQLLNQERYGAAIAQFDAGIELAPGYAANYFLKGLALRRDGRPDEALRSYRTAITVAEEGSESSMTAKARTNIGGIFLRRAEAAFQEDRFARSIAALDSARTYATSEISAQHHFYYARGHRGLGHWESVLDHAEQGLGMASTRNRTLTSNLLYMKGLAHKHRGQLETARAAFEQVDAGPYQQNAQYELAHNLGEAASG